MISGSIVALITPMTPTGDIDWRGLDDLVEWHVAEGTHSILMEKNRLKLFEAVQAFLDEGRKE